MIRFGTIQTADCLNILPPPDPRCSDPGFALNNPDICGRVQTLSIKPGTALACQLGSIQFKSFFNDGTGETDVTATTIWTSSDLSVVMIGASSGNATGVGPGVTTVTATYQGHVTTAQITVLSGSNCCTQQKVALLVMIDDTKSMSQGFGAGYATRLTFAKATATRFISEINGTKDVVGLSSFHSALVDVEATITSDVASVVADVPGIVQTQDKTEFYDAVVQGIAALDAVTAFQKVLVIMSDGEDTLTQSFQASNDPLVPLQDFKSQGGIVICLGTRASGTGYSLLQAMATGGFFINGIPANADATLDYLSGLKGYVCAGNCTPLGDQMIPTGQADYAGFVNWVVSAGTVDLLGNGFFDFMPGNGLYVDLGGTTSPQRGLMTLKNAITLTAGKTYELGVNLAGNQRINDLSFSAQVQLIEVSTGLPVLNNTVAINNFASPFTWYSFAFTPSYNMVVNIAIQQNASAAGDDPRVGLILNEVRLLNTTDLINVFDDTFDTENPVYVPPRCGTGTTYVFNPTLHKYGYVSSYTGCYGTGCLTDPPVAQLPDPNPLSDIESGSTPTTTYISTQRSCATCDPGMIQVSGVNLIPVMTSNTTPSGTASASTVTITGAAWRAFDGNLLTSGWESAVVVPLVSQWLAYQFTVATVVSGYEIFYNPTTELAVLPITWTFEGSNDGAAWTVLDTQTNINWIALQSSQRFNFTNTTAYTYYRLNMSDKRAGSSNSFKIQELAMYAGASDVPVCANATKTSNVSQSNADDLARAAALVLAKAMLTCAQVFTSTKNYTAHCPDGTYGALVTRSGTATSFSSQQDADDKALAIATAAANAARNCTGSNNAQAITITDSIGGVFAKAIPFPSVKFISGFVGVVTNVQVTLNGFGHASPSDVLIILAAPTGAKVMLMQHCGGVLAVTGLNLSFATGSPALPQNTILSSGTFRPTQFGVNGDFPAPAPAGPYSAALTAFNGINPNGAWGLWIVDVVPLYSGQITGGWDMVIT